MNRNCMNDIVCVGDQVVGAGCHGLVLAIHSDGTADVMTNRGDIMIEVCFQLLIVDHWESGHDCQD